MSASLFDRFTDLANLEGAYRKVQKKGARGGIDNVSVDEFGAKLKSNLKRLRNEIVSGSYTPEPVQEVLKPKFNSKNEYRRLGLPTVADKVVQTALLQVIEPIAERMFLDTSYAYRPRKGHRKAIRRVEHNLRTEKRTWVVHQDIDNFFDTLDHDRLLRLFDELVEHDQRLVELVALWCKSGIVAKGNRWKNVEAGVRQGQVISPLLANLYLHELDVFVQKNGWGWVRYADDYLLQCTEKSEVREADRKIRQYLKNELGLRLNANDSPVSNLESGFTFLGILFKGEERRISRKKIEKMKSKLGWILSPKRHLDLDETFEKLRRTVDAWQNYYGFLGQGEQFSAVEQFLDERLVKLVTRRISTKEWPEKLPGHVDLPLPSARFLQPGETRRRLADIWHRAQRSVAQATRKKVERKTSARRRQHRRQEVVAGEIFVISPGHFVGRRQGRIVVRKKQRIVAELPLSMLRGITVADKSLAISTDIVSYCCKKDIAFHLMDHLGHITAAINRPDGIRADTVLKQVSFRDHDIGLELARMFVYGKVRNQLAILKAYSKYKGHRQTDFGKKFNGMRGELEKLARKIKNLHMDKKPQDFRNCLMGLEGTIASRYWMLVSLILPGHLNFNGRKRRGASDILNCLLNYGYGILYSQALNAVTRAGLNAMAGFLHSYQQGKPVLTFDLVEEFRAPVVDKTIFSLVNRRVNFKLQKDGLLDEASRKKVAAAITARLGTEVTHRGHRDTLQKIIFLQAEGIRDHLYGKRTYKPYLSKW